ncbi:MAG: hypothetical protein NTZ09_10145 [Candidatus Hydrogenedentes bacterium]|nr:hypothetical protein [Candidatus Hydrogenedentota bacterium]
MIRFVTACALCTAFSMPMVYAAEQTAAATDAASVVKQMAQTYSACKSYRDSGTSVTKFLGDTPHENKIQFKTAFRRPTDFRFEYNSENGIMGDRMIIHRDQTGTRTWWSIGAGEQATTLDMAIAGATGVSDGTAFNVPTMLFPEEVGGWSFTSREGWTALPDAEENGRPCCRVTRKEEKGDYETIWIDKSTFLLMRIDERRTIDGKRGTFVTEQTTLYRPEINVDIPDADLQFNPPADAPKGPAPSSQPRLLRFFKALLHG